MVAPICEEDMRFAIVGCGYVAEFYFHNLPNHPGLELSGVFDCDATRSKGFADFHRLRAYSSFEDVLKDSSVQLVANLTNPRSHYAVSKAALEAGKHVYSEKPLAMTFEEAEKLVQLAEERGLLLASAPCNLLGETAQTIWKALRDGRIGTPRLVYAELDDSFLFMNYREWINKSGVSWPFTDEFSTGCTLEHAGYYLGWLTAFFGPATDIVSSTGVSPSGSDRSPEHYAPAFSTACIHFGSGVVARITCSSFTSGNHLFRVFGDDGILSTSECWDYASPVYVNLRIPRSWRDRHPRRAALLGVRPHIPLVRRPSFAYERIMGLRMDFARGIAELADSLAERREPRLSARWSLHITELALAMSAGEGLRREVRTSFAPITPMPWGF
jgi:predicted dehydrogenase